MIFGANMISEDEKPKPKTTIEVRAVTKQFGSNIAVDDVTFDIRKGEVVGFLGPNGSGKTTTMRLLTSFYTPDKGTILIDGIDNQEHDLETRKKIGYLPENNPVYGDLLVKDQLDFVAELRGIHGNDRRTNIDRAVEETGLQEVYYRPVRQCSKGYKQRVGLAQAILHRPEILIMDEPTEGLDPNQRVPIRELIRSIGAERTVLLSTHVLQEVEETCDRLLIICRGRIVAQGTVDELRKMARRDTVVSVEVVGDDAIENSLNKLKSVRSVQSVGRIGDRKRFLLSVYGKVDVRPEVFELAKKRDWTLWEIHEETGRLQDLFYELTRENSQEG